MADGQMVTNVLPDDRILGTQQAVIKDGYYVS